MSIFKDMIGGRCINNFLAVKFDVKSKELIELGDTGIKLIIPAKWDERDEDGNIKYDDNGVVKSAYNVNGLESQPQICEVMVANPDYPYRVGDRLFTHYMAFETAQCGDTVTNEAIIIADYVFFKILPNGEWELKDDVYIGQPLYTGEEVTKSGIVAELGRKESLKVTITHIPKNYPKWYPEHPVKVGDIVLSIDSYNYEFDYYGEKFIKLTNEEIAGKLVDNGIKLLKLA